ncbi:protein-L-isoaspartate(D-aspartate) O-methyltransferase [Bartonella sp. DGB2]|uniref:protein-L-isoaspartate(D-aspartate) O-methyltransferase n=1 Tax=Bartonella sp. DGB2 TaxID=3388426 RepID=UPI00398FC9F9
MASTTLSQREELAHLMLRLRAKGLDDMRIFAALEHIPRQNFVPRHLAESAYENKIIPISCGEYIERLEEQLMILAALKLEKKHRVLEVGTGSGFCTALIAYLAGRVLSVERYKTLADKARERFRVLKLDNIVLRQTDGSHIVAGAGPFDRIIIWPSRRDDPHEFLEILSGNGLLIQAIGAENGPQIVVCYSKMGSQVERADILKVRYQPFIEGVAAAL